MSSSKIWTSRILFVNSHMKKAIWSTELIGHTPQEIFLAEEAQGILDDDKEALRLRVKQWWMKCLIRMDNTGISNHEICDWDEGEDTFIGGISLDFTEKVRAEERSRRFYKRLEIINEIDKIVLEALSLDQIGSAVWKSAQAYPMQHHSIHEFVDGKSRFQLFIQTLVNILFSNRGESYEFDRISGRN